MKISVDDMLNHLKKVRDTKVKDYAQKIGWEACILEIMKLEYELIKKDRRSK